MKELDIYLGEEKLGHVRVESVRGKEVRRQGGVWLSRRHRS